MTEETALGFRSERGPGVIALMLDNKFFRLVCQAVDLLCMGYRNHVISVAVKDQNIAEGRNSLRDIELAPGGIKYDFGPGCFESAAC